MRDLWQLVREAIPYRRAVIVLTLLALTQSAAALALPWLGSQVLDVLMQLRVPTRSELVLGIFGLLATNTLATVLAGRISAATSANILAGLRIRMYEHLQALPQSWHDAQSHGSVLALVTYEVGHLGTFITGPLVRTLPMLIMVAGAFVLIIQIDPILGLAAPILLPTYFVVARLVGRSLRKLAEDEQQAESDLVAFADENLSTMLALKSFAREEIETRRFRGLIILARDISVRIEGIIATTSPVLGFIAASVTLGLLMLAGRRLQTGAMSLQEFIALLLYTATLIRPVGELVGIWGQLQTTLGTLRRMRSVLDAPAEPGYAFTGVLPEGPGEVRFESVSFGYPGRETVIDSFSCTIAPGEAVSLVGSNGAGKSTLIALLLRFHEPDEGRILIDGQDISKVNVRNLREQVALVPQRPQLLNATIRENISYGAEHVTQAQILRAAQQADAMEFISTLPDGFDTMIGDRGVKLSGGQGQRIALARALLKDARIYVLDEATSMYDVAGEARFVENCAKALAGRTLIIITHRPVSLELVTRMIRL